MRFPLNFSSMLSRRRGAQQRSRGLSERQIQDARTPEEIDTWCKLTSLTKNGDEIMFPNQGDTWYAGETKGFGWTGGIHIDDKQIQTFSLELSAFGLEDGDKGPETISIFANKTFQYPSSNWQLWSDECPDTYLSYYWTIPKDFDVGNTKFVAKLLNSTDPDNKTTLKSSFFYIDSDTTQASIKAIEPTESAALSAVTTLPASETPTVSSTDGISISPLTATPEAAADGQVIAANTHSGLSVQAKAGIGAGVGVLGLMLILAGFFLYWYKKRQNRGISDKGFVKPDLEVRTARPRISEGGNSEIQRARAREMEGVPGSPLYRTQTERERNRRSIRIVYEPNQDPIGLPADFSMWSPKTSQEGLNK